MLPGRFVRRAVKTEPAGQELKHLRKIRINPGKPESLRGREEEFKMRSSYSRHGMACLVVFCALVAACANKGGVFTDAQQPIFTAELSEPRPGSDRLVIRSASLTLEVSGIGNVVKKIISHIEKQGGGVESKSISGEKDAYLKFRVPSDSLTEVIGSLAGFGREKHRNLSSTDVTGQYIDVEARLQNAVALRDRLRVLLDKATDIKDVLAIERELSRVQGEIDAMEGRIKRLKGTIDFATIELYLENKTVLGPLGFVVKGIGWFVEKMFVLK